MKNTSFHPLLIKTFHAYTKQLRPYMTQLGLSEGQPKILCYVQMNDGCLQKDLADWYNIKPATVSRLLNNMEEQGLLRRETPEDNRRTTKVYITKKGSEKFEQFIQYRKQIDEIAFKGFSSEERAVFTKHLDRIRSNLL